MSDAPKSWMPFWLATYICIVACILGIVANSMFCTWAYENDLEYTWQIGLCIFATMSLPWVWYFTYLGYRYLDTIPSLYYLWIAAPIYCTLSTSLSQKTLYFDIFSFNGSMYAIHIGWEVILQLAIILVVIHELSARRQVYNGFLAQIRRALDDI